MQHDPRGIPAPVYQQALTLAGQLLDPCPTTTTEGGSFPSPVGQVTFSTSQLQSSAHQPDRLRRLTTAAVRGTTVWYLSQRSSGDSRFLREPLNYFVNVGARLPTVAENKHLGLIQTGCIRLTRR